MLTLSHPYVDAYCQCRHKAKSQAAQAEPVPHAQNKHTERHHEMRQSKDTKTGCAVRMPALVFPQKKSLALAAAPAGLTLQQR